MGYANITPTEVSGGRYSGGGSSFLAVGGSGYSLKDFRIEGAGGEYGEDDIIQFIQSDVAKLDNAKSFYFDSDYKNWAYALGQKEGEEVSEEDLNAIIPAGTGFLCNFKTSTAKIVYSGEVNMGEGGKIICGRGLGRYIYTVNPNPYEISLADVKIENAGGEYGENDIIQFMQNNTAKLDNAKSFYFDSDYKNWAYALGQKEGEEVEDASAIKIKAGEAFLLNAKTDAARVVFKAPVLK